MSLKFAETWQVVCSARPDRMADLPPPAENEGAPAWLCVLQESCFPPNSQPHPHVIIIIILLIYMRLSRNSRTNITSRISRRIRTNHKINNKRPKAIKLLVIFSSKPETLSVCRQQQHGGLKVHLGRTETFKPCS